MVWSLILYSVSLFAKIERKWSNGHAISIQQFFNYGSTGNVLPRKVSIVNNYPLIRPKQFSSFTSTRTILCNIKSQDGVLDALPFQVKLQRNSWHSEEETLQAVSKQCARLSSGMMPNNKSTMPWIEDMTSISHFVLQQQYIKRKTEIHVFSKPQK